MDPRSFIMGSGTPGFSFIRPGDRIVGQIIGEPVTKQMKVWRNGQPTDELAFWPSGEPKWQLCIPLQTQFRNYEGLKNPDRNVPDDGKRTVYLNGKHREAALKRAIQSAGMAWLEVGGWYDETYTGDDYESNAGIKPKLAEIRVAPASPEWKAQQRQAQQPAEPVYAAQAQVNAQQAQYAQQQPPPAPPVAVPSHHGTPEAMPQWAQSAPPMSAPPVQSAPPAQSAAMSTLEQLRAARNGTVPGGFDEEPPF
jgi:hypothetical protein